MWDMLSRRPLVFLLLTYLGGIVLGQLFSPALLPLLYLILLALLLSAVVYYFTRRPAILVLVLLIVALGGGFVNYEFSTRYLPPNHISNNFKPGSYIITGRLISPPIRLSSKDIVYLEVEKIKRDGVWREVTGRVRLNVYKPRPNRSHLNRSRPDLHYGDRIRTLAKLRLPANFENPGGFDYRAYLARRGILVVGSVSPKTFINRLARGERGLLSIIYEAKQRMSEFIGAVYPDPQAGLLRALVLGERMAVSRSIRDEFTAAGLAHLLAISGMHVGFVGFIFFGLFRFVLRRLPARLFERLTAWVRPTKLAALLIIPLLISYTLLVGGRTSTVRATIMILAYILSLLVDRQRDLYNTLALAALVILVWKPTSLVEIDFQLSFVTVFFIIYAISCLYQREARQPSLSPPSRLERFGRKLGGYVLVTVTASLAATPLVVFYFKRLSLVGILANLTAVPLAWIVIPLGLSAGLLSLFSISMGKLLLSVNLIFMDMLLGLVHRLAGLPLASLRLSPPGWLPLSMFYGFLLSVFRLRRSAWARACAIGLLLSGGVLWWLGQQSPTDKNLLRVTFLDVGHGESSFISFPGGKNMLIDGGGFYNDSFDIGERVVSAYLWSQGVERLDWVVLSHAHPDHMNGLKSVVRNFEVGEVWEAPRHYESADYVEFKSLLAQRNILLRSVSAGDNFNPEQGVDVFILNPPLALGQDVIIDKQTGENNRSLVLRLEYGRVSFLFTGDIERKAEKYLLKRPELLASTVLKVPHHGSNTSSSLRFLQAVRPQAAVFSIAPSYMFWHPSPKMFARYESLGVRILRTDLHGAVTIETDGISYNVSGWKKSYRLGKISLMEDNCL
jgi:competence protein ComEC